MAIKYQWQSLQRKIYNGQDISKVIINWSQIRPTEQQHVNYHIVSDWTNSGWWGGGWAPWVPSGWTNNWWVISAWGVSNWWTWVTVNQKYQWLPSLKNAYKIVIVYKFERDQATAPTPFDATLLRLNNREYQTQLVSWRDQVLWLSSNNTATLTWPTSGTYTITTTLELNDMEWTQVMDWPNGFHSTVAIYLINATERTNIRNCNEFIVYLNNWVTLSSVDFYIYNNAPVTHSDMQWPCPTWFHVPLKTEWQWVLNAYTWLWLSRPNDFSNYLKLPKSWTRSSYDWSVSSQWTYGYYWSSTYRGYGDWEALYFYFMWPYITYYASSSGFSIRPFKDTPTEPDWNRNIIYQWAWSAWIYWNPSLWLISISSDGTTWYTIADKNIWATQVWDYGNYYQWGNNYGFSNVWSVTTSSTQVDTTGYWPWNYYYSWDFITDSSGWMNPDNANLRWWVSQGTWQWYD